MDDRYREGFERLLSDMDEPPSWEEVSTQHVAPAPVPSRSRGLLIAAAAFAVTVVAVGAVVLALAGGSEPKPVAAPAVATVDYIKISWSQDVELQCGDMDAVDNGGFSRATVEIWGPNVDGLIRVDATAPDGTVERLITTQPFDRSVGRKVWSTYERGVAEAETVFRVAECVDNTPGGSSHFSMSDAPLDARGHVFAAFISTPTELPGGSSYEAVLARGATVRDDVWRGIPVTVFTRNTSDVDEMVGASAGVSETWLDTAAGRWERRSDVTHLEATGTVTTIIEVVERDTVPAESVSFSTEGLILTLDMPPTDLSDDELTAVTTTTTTVPDIINAAAFVDIESLDAEINRRHAMIDEAMANRDEAAQEIERNNALLDALEAQVDPPAMQVEIDRQMLVLRVSQLQREHAEELIRRHEEIVARLQARRAELIAVSAAAERRAAVARAEEYAPYLVADPVGMTPPPSLLGTDGASGSGCFPGSGDLPDGIWFGTLLARNGLSIDFDLDCMYYGQAAWDLAAFSGEEALGDVWFVNRDAIVRTLPVAAATTVWMITGDATKGHQALSFDREWTGAESTYASCPGEDCPVWIYINGGTVDAIVQQYLP